MTDALAANRRKLGLRGRFADGASRLIWIMAVVFLVACGGSSYPEPRSGLRVDRDCPSADRGDYYYPEGAIVANNRNGEDDFWRDWYGKYLRSANALPLWCGATTEAYRFLWLPSYRPAMIVELTRRGNDWQVIRIAFKDPRKNSSSQQANPLSVNERVESAATEESVAPFLQTLNDASFWVGSAYLSSKKEDGHRWVIEGRRDGLYRVVTRHEASDQQFENAARVLVKLAGADIPEEMKLGQ